MRNTLELSRIRAALRRRPRAGRPRGPRAARCAASGRSRGRTASGSTSPTTCPRCGSTCDGRADPAQPARERVAFRAARLGDPGRRERGAAISSSCAPPTTARAFRPTRTRIFEEFQSVDTPRPQRHRARPRHRAGAGRRPGRHRALRGDTGRRTHSCAASADARRVTTILLVEDDPALRRACAR